MPIEQTIPYILTLAKGCEYYAACKIGNHEALQGGDINQTWARLIYMERMAVQNRYNLNPSDPTLRATANYLFSILRYVGPVQTNINNLLGTKPAITGPANESTTVGGSATVTVSVTSSTPYVVRWIVFSYGNKFGRDSHQQSGHINGNRIDYRVSVLFVNKSWADPFS
jgi:hypothetical protein